MPYQDVVIRPGLSADTTKTLTKAGWNACQLVRFRDGLPEKNGPWEHLTTSPLVGTARGMVTWADVIANKYLAVGTEQTLSLWYSNSYYDLTPYEVFSNLATPFSTTLSSAVVQVNDVNIPAGCTELYVVMPTSVNGLLLFGRYAMSYSGGYYTITAASGTASSTGAGGAVPEFAVTNGSFTVTVTLADHGLTSGNTFTVQVATTLGGMTLAANSDYTVTVVNTSTFTFTGPSAATSNASVYENAGNVQIGYQLTSGYASQTGNYLLRQWFLDHWGRDMVGTAGGTNDDFLMSYGSPVFVYDPESPTLYGGHAYAINTSTFPGATSPPNAANVSFVIAAEQILMVLGSDPAGGTAQDPNLIRWCNTSDFTDWVATATNQAGSFRIPTGSRLVGGLRAPMFTVIWTDLDMYLVSYLGFPLVFGFNLVTGGVGLIAARACAAVQSTVYWVSADNFWKFDGNSAQIVPCPIWDVLFRNLDRTQVDKMHMAVNSFFSELMVFFPSASGSGEVDTYVRYNFREGLWDYGSLVRTTWVDAGVLGAPIGVDGSGILQQHETGTDADGAQMNEYIETGWISLDAGDFFVYIDRVIMDFKMASNSDTVQYWISVVDYPTDTPVVYGPYTQALTGPSYQIIRARGRLASIKIGVSSLGAWWRLGAIKALMAPAGKR